VSTNFSVSRATVRTLAENVAALYGVHFASYLLPLVTLPFLARTLEPAGWGMVALAQSLGQYLGFIVEYGFEFSATRETARLRGQREKLAELLSGILGAKILLAVAAVCAALCAARWIPAFQQNAGLVWMGVFAGLAQGLNVLWYFQGLERMRLVASVDIAGRIIATAGIFLLVRGPADGWIVLALSGAVSLFSTLMMTALAHSETGFRIPTLGLALRAAARGWTMFLFRASTGLFTTANVFLLGLFAPPSVVGWFAGAEKISKASWSLLWPLTRALFPRMSHLVHTRAPEARATARASFRLMLAGGIVTGLILFLFAPVLVNSLLGREYRPAVAILRILSVLPPVVALNSFLCIHCMLPMGMDAAVNKVVLGAGALNVVLTLLFTPAYGQWAVSWSVVFAETFVLFGLWRAVRRSRGPLDSLPETLDIAEA